MSTLKAWIENRIVRNLVIWFVAWLGLVNIIETDNPSNRYLSALGALAYLAIPVYINNLKILPLFRQNKMVKGVILCCINMLFFTLALCVFLSVTDEEFQWRLIFHIFGLVFFMLMFGSAIKIASDSLLKRQQAKEAELKLLKAQLNPHFLFNTLNNLYGLAKIKSDKLPGLMLKLSDLLRYSLYDTKEALVPLKKELQYLENYISLERIRLEDKTQIDVKVNGSEAGIQIAPMLLIVFVENAFKHLGTTKDGKSKVTIALDISKKEVVFTCINTIDTLNANYNTMETGKSGIGLLNAKKRLDLMYPNIHELIMNTNEHYHTVQLKLMV